MTHATNELGWVEAVGTDWPGPIAHEYQALRGLFPESRVEAAKADYQVLAAFLQLRDVAEILVKLPALVMLRDADRLGLDVTKIKSKMLDSPSFGDWYGWANTLAKQLLEHEAEAWTAAAARIFRLPPQKKVTGLSQLFNGPEGLIHWRNRELGHGALRKDLDVLARELTERVVGLNEQLALVAAAQPWKDLTLRITGAKQPLVGHESIRRSHDASAGSHTDTVASVVCDYGSASRRLDLGPYLAARICRKCDWQDVFFFNGRSGNSPPHQVQYLDYRMGHSLLEPQANDPRWADEVSKAKGASVRGSVGDDWIDTAVSELLDGTDFEREYVPPTYMADGIRRFLEEHDRGIVWLRAPAHTGKTVIAEKAAKLLADDPGDVFVATFKIKREYRYGIEAFKTFIAKAFLPDTDVNHPFAWARADGKALAKAFAADADRLLERARDLSAAHDRVLLVIDGLDELPAPGTGDSPDIRHGIADLIPKADALPAGMFLLLTSRPVEKGETPAWVRRKVETALRGQKHVHTIDIDRDTPDYRRLLRQVFDKALVTPVKKSRRPKHPDTLFETIGNRADWTFLHFTHLVRLLKDGVISEADLSAMEEHGDQLYLAYFRKLEDTVGHKHFDRIRELLLVLAACEEAHAQAARIVPPLFFDAEWKGLPLDELTGLLHELSPGEGKDGPRVPLRMLFLLKSVADVLRSHRGDDDYSRHRIGLKGMVAAMRADRRPDGWAESLDATHLRLVREAIAAENTEPDSDPAAHESYLLQRGWLHARAILENGTSTGQAAVVKPLEAFALPHQELIEVASYQVEQWEFADACEICSIAIDHIRWRMTSACRRTGLDDLQELAMAYCNRAGIRAVYHDSAGAAEDYQKALEMDEASIAAAGKKAPWNLRYGLAITLQNRGELWQRQGNDSQLVKDLLRASSILEKLHTAVDEDWRSEVDEKLALVLSNLGCMQQNKGRLPVALRHFDRAIALLDAVRKDQAYRWHSETCTLLASTLMNRAILHESSDMIQKASRDYTRAITILDKYIDRTDDWSLEAWQTSAEAFANRAGLTANGKRPSLVLADYVQAVFRLKSLQHMRAADCPPEVSQHLAEVYRNRGDFHAESRRFRRAITDYGRAIATLETLRDELGERWSSDMVESLADLHALRAEARGEAKDAAGSLADYGQAIELLDFIDYQGVTSGSPAVRINIAKYHANRANARLFRNDSNGALQDASRAIGLLEEFMNESGRTDSDQLADWYGTAFVAYMTRAEIHHGAGALEASLVDHTKAIKAMEGVRKKFTTDWDADMKNDLRIAYKKRAVLFEKLGRRAAARADRRRAEHLGD